MIPGSSGLPGMPSDGMRSACSTSERDTCSLRKAAVGAASWRNGAKDSLTRCEVEVFLSLAPGHGIAVRDNETGEFWNGSIDVTFPEQGFVWAFTELGERKLLDISVHTVWQPATPLACGDGDEKRAIGVRSQ